MKKNILVFFVFFFSMLSSYSAIARTPMVELEYAIESDALDIRLSNDLTGIVKGRRCDTCDIELLKITPDTKVEIRGLAVDLIKAKARSGKPGVVIYNIKSREVRVISFY